MAAAFPPSCPTFVANRRKSITMPAATHPSNVSASLTLSDNFPYLSFHLKMYSCSFWAIISRETLTYIHIFLWTPPTFPFPLPPFDQLIKSGLVIFFVIVLASCFFLPASVNILVDQNPSTCIDVGCRFPCQLEPPRAALWLCLLCILVCSECTDN